MGKLTHLTEKGQVHMVDVTEKATTHRTAVATGSIVMQPETLQSILSGANKKGTVFATARLAGIMAAKKTSDLIPLCHPIALSKITVEIEPDKKTNTIHTTVRVTATEKTGVEMEALCAVQVVLLTIYDMCKAMDRGMVIQKIMLLEKDGGQSGHWIRHLKTQ